MSESEGSRSTAVLDRLVSEAAAWDDIFGPQGPCPLLLERSEPQGRFLLVTGENVGGKSLFARLLGALARRDGLVAMDIGMARRTTPDMSRVFIFGDETRSSTGSISVHTSLAALRNSRENWKEPHLVVLDEPDVGLSEGYAAALGRALADHAKDIPGSCAGLVLVTHSREIVREVLPLASHVARVGDDLRPTEEWLRDGSLPRTLDELLALQQVSYERCRAVQLLLNPPKPEEEKPAPKGRRR